MLICGPRDALAVDQAVAFARRWATNWTTWWSASIHPQRVGSRHGAVAVKTARDGGHMPGLNDTEMVGWMWVAERAIGNARIA